MLFHNQSFEYSYYETIVTLYIYPDIEEPSLRIRQVIYTYLKNSFVGQN